ncbi:hypothetical protein [Leyella stercorea]
MFFFKHPESWKYALDGGRNLIGRRTQSDWTADAIRSDGGRNR